MSERVSDERLKEWAQGPNGVWWPTDMARELLEWRALGKSPEAVREKMHKPWYCASCVNLRPDASMRQTDAQQCGSGTLSGCHAAEQAPRPTPMEALERQAREAADEAWRIAASSSSVADITVARALTAVRDLFAGARRAAGEVL